MKPCTIPRSSEAPIFIVITYIQGQVTVPNLKRCRKPSGGPEGGRLVWEGQATFGSRSPVTRIWKRAPAPGSSFGVGVGDSRSSRAQRHQCAGFALPRDAGGDRRRPRDEDLEGEWGRGLRLAGRSVIGAGFALPRDAGRRPALLSSGHAVTRIWKRRSAPGRCWGGGWQGAASSAAGLRAPADAGRRPALPGRGHLCEDLEVDAGSRQLRSVLGCGDFRSRLSGVPISTAGFALPRDAGRRPALRVARWHPAPVRVRPSPLANRSQVSAQRHRGAGFAAPARCRSETGAPVSTVTCDEDLEGRFGSVLGSDSGWQGAASRWFQRSRAMPSCRRPALPLSRSTCDEELEERCALRSVLGSGTQVGRAQHRRWFRAPACDGLRKCDRRSAEVSR